MIQRYRAGKKPNNMPEIIVINYVSGAVKVLPRSLKAVLLTDQFVVQNLTKS